MLVERGAARDKVPVVAAAGKVVPEGSRGVPPVVAALGFGLRAHREVHDVLGVPWIVAGWRLVVDLDWALVGGYLAGFP